MNVKRSRLPWLKSLNIIHWILTLMPAMMLLALSLTTWRASIVLGHTPIPSIDDPKNIKDNLAIGLYIVTALLWLAQGLLPYIWFPFTAVMLSLHHRNGRSLKAIVLYGLIHTVLFISMFWVIGLDLAGQLYWFMD
jgi:hypothetical protein